MTPGRVLILGGARSGKSTAAEARFSPDSHVRYVAPGRRDPSDDEWESRIRAHQNRRSPHWSTLETSDIADPVASASPDAPVLVDCLTTWLSGRLDRANVWGSDPSPAWPGQDAAVAKVRSDIDDLVDAVSNSTGGLVMVSNEVGSGVVPATVSGRLFRDLMGICNAAIADACDEVILVVAGCQLPIKKPEDMQ